MLLLSVQILSSFWVDFNEISWETSVPIEDWHFPSVLGYDDFYCRYGPLRNLVSIIPVKLILTNS